MSALKTTADLAEYFNVPERRIYEWRVEHDWPCVKIGRTIRFTDEHVAEIMARHTVTGEARATQPQPLFVRTKRSAARTRRY
ncbi:helix-turn-helix domain-containing protein [Nocardioides sp. AN3]